MEVFINFKKLSEKYPVLKEISYNSKTPKLYQALIYLANSENIRNGMICREIGHYYLYGDGGVKRDLDDALMWFGIGADTYKDPICQYHLGKIYRQKNFKDEELANNYTYSALINLCDSVDNVNAMFLYKLRTKSIENLDKENPELDLCIDRKNAYLIYIIGNIFLDKSFKLYDVERAYYCYYISAHKGYAKAYKKLGDIAYKGLLGNKDTELAISEYEKALKNGYKPAGEILANIYVKPLAYQNLKRAEKLFRESLTYSKTANYKLAVLYSKYPDVFNKSEKTIGYNYNQYIKKNQNTNSPTEILNIAKLYLNGAIGFDKNVEEAIRFYKKAARLNNIDAMYTLGYIYSSNKFGVKNKKYSNYSYKKAFDALINAEKQYANSYNEYRLGKMFLYGLGVKKDIAKAEKCFKKAIATDKNNAPVAFELYRILRKSNLKRAEYYLNYACNLKYEPALKICSSSK